MNWNNMSNMEIKQKMESMVLEYESIKNKINKLINNLDKLDIDYDNAKKEIERRGKK